MNVKEFYIKIGGNYDEALSRLMNDSLIEKFVLKFANSDYISGVKNAIDAKNYDDLFFQAHTLKGVALNLAFTRLGASASALTDYVRGDNKETANHEEILRLFSKVESDYNCVINALK